MVRKHINKKNLKRKERRRAKRIQKRLIRRKINTPKKINIKKELHKKRIQEINERYNAILEQVQKEYHLYYPDLSEIQARIQKIQNRINIAFYSLTIVFFLILLCVILFIKFAR